MREILFRGKSIDGGFWIEGSLRITTHDPINGNLYKRYEIEDTTYGEFPNDYMCGICETVDPETVGQFTGLKDKNGKKIFEGDVVEHDFGIEQIGKQRAIIKYSEKYASFMIEPIDDWMSCGKSDCEAIGNIHDNPALLEV